MTRSFLDKAGILVSCSHCGSFCTGLLDGVVHSELVKGILRKISLETDNSAKILGPRSVKNERTSMFTGKLTNLHAAGIVLGLGHPDVKASLLISGSGRCNCSTGLLVGAVDGQFIKSDLR